jgi:hypothetical protein
MKALIIDCTLKSSPERSNTAVLGEGDGRQGLVPLDPESG